MKKLTGEELLKLTSEEAKQHFDAIDDAQALAEFASLIKIFVFNLYVRIPCALLKIAGSYFRSCLKK